MARAIFLLLFLIGLPVMLIGCQRIEANTESETELPQIAYAAHLWKETEAAPLVEALDTFQQIANAIILFESAETVPKTLAAQFAAGLGPDIIIGLSYTEMAELAEAGLLYDLSTFRDEFDAYQPDQIEALTHNGKLYGLPFMATTSVLFYNTAQVSSAPRSLDQLVAAASEGAAVAIPIDFEQAFWGLGAFGGMIFSQDGRAEATPENYAAWFRWLIRAQNRPGLVMDEDLELLKSKFIEGEVAYLIAPIDNFGELAQALGEEVVNVAPIPGVEYAPNPEIPEMTLVRSAAPLLSMEVIAFNKTANEDQLKLGLALAQFLNNPTVQRKLILAEPNRAPTNLKVAIQFGLSEVGNAIVRQRRTSIIIPLSRLAQFQQFSQAVDTIYLQVLDGGLSADEAADQLSRLLNRTFEE
jgi:maltose-binding protein MalE